MEKWQLANKFSDSKVGCDGNTLLPAKKELKNSLFFFFFLIKNVLPKNFATFSNVFKAKESPRVTFECRKRVSQPEFIDQDLQINMIMSYLEIKILFHKLTDFEKKLVAFPLLDSCLSAEMRIVRFRGIVKNCALAKVEIKLFWHTRHPMINESRDLVGDIPSP